MITYKRIDETSTDGIIYIGEAELNTPITESKWRIKVIDKTGDEIIERFPVGPDGYQRYEYEFKWSDRTTYNYK